MTELKPCPLCGRSVGWRGGAIACLYCGLEFRTAGGDKEAMEKYWNRRACNPASSVTRCKNCAFFEHNSWGTIGGVKCIIAHDICTRLGRGCRTNPEGFCHLGEMRDDNVE